MISDTHNQHADIGRLAGGVLIHCGDMTVLFDRSSDDLQRIDGWFGEQEFDLRLCTGVSHGLLLEELVLGVAGFPDESYDFDDQANAAGG